jgi:hypothetical protein
MQFLNYIFGPLQAIYRYVKKLPYRQNKTEKVVPTTIFFTFLSFIDFDLNALSANRLSKYFEFGQSVAFSPFKL